MISFTHICRAKRKSDRKWVYGFYLHSFGAEEHDYIITYFSKIQIERFEIDVDTLGICTGIEDPNQIMIFEGDLIGHEYNVVEMTSGSFCTNGDRDLYLQSRTSCVVGNQWDGVIKHIPKIEQMLTYNQLVEVHKDGKSGLSDRETILRLLGG